MKNDTIKNMKYRRDWNSILFLILPNTILQNIFLQIEKTIITTKNINKWRKEKKRSTHTIIHIHTQTLYNMYTYKKRYLNNTKREIMDGDKL
jgi:hypothetical protein